MIQQDNESNKNAIIAMGLIMLILLGWGYFREAPVVMAEPEDPTTLTAPLPQQLPSSAPAVSGVAPSVAVPQDRNKIIKSSERLAIKAPGVSGTIRLQGARLDDLSLNKYHQDVDPSSPPITLLSPEESERPYYADFGWITPDQSIRVPDVNTLWRVQGNAILTPEAPVVLLWENGQGVTFERTIRIDDAYMFTISARVLNDTNKPLSLYAYGQVMRGNLPEISSFFILHEGPIGYLGDKLVEIKYEDLREKAESMTSKGGWAGLTDKYWLTALIPAQEVDAKVTYRHLPVGKDQRYFAEYTSALLTISPGQSVIYKGHFFAGAKELATLDAYEEKLGIKHLDLAVDFGWFYFLTKPIFIILTYAKDYLGNFGLSILLLTVILKLLFFPLANRAYRSMARMKELQPKMNRLRELYKDDKLRMNQELMELYKREKINPLAGCLPMVAQIPVFFALYKVLFISIEMRQAPFYGWIHDLSVLDPTNLFNLFGLIPWDPPAAFHVGIWPLLMGATMFLQQRLNPSTMDPIQEKVFMVMPLIFTFTLASFPAGLVIYWAWNNILSITQQLVIMRLETQRKAR